MGEDSGVQGRLVKWDEEVKAILWIEDLELSTASHQQPIRIVFYRPRLSDGHGQR